MKKDFFTTTELAKLMGVNRITIFRKIKKGEIKAIKVGRNFVIDKKDLGIILGESLSFKQKKEIDNAVMKTIKEYGETLKLLGAE